MKRSGRLAGMDFRDRQRLYIQRAENELNLAKTIFRLSNEPKMKEAFELKPDVTFYSNVISTCYYCVFYSAKAFLLKKGILTEPPEEHRKTYEEFSRLVESGDVDVELLKIYRIIAIRAEELLGILKREKRKRGKFTYYKLPQANMEPAQESLENAAKFFRNIYLMLGS
jgi:uncharacterized protein (UPF0332 family)